MLPLCHHRQCVALTIQTLLSVSQTVCLPCPDNTYGEKGSTYCRKCPTGSDPADVRNKMESQNIKELLIQKCLSIDPFDDFILFLKPLILYFNNTDTRKKSSSN